MSRALQSFILVAVLAPAAGAAQVRDSGAYVVTLGSDTIAVERFVHTPGRLTIEAVTRLPQTRLARLTILRDAAGRITSYEHVNSPVPGIGGAAEIRTIAEYRADSVHYTVTQGANAPRVRTIAGSPDMMPLITPIYSTHAAALVDARVRGAAELVLLTQQGPVRYTLRNVGDTVFMTGPESAGMLKASLDEGGLVLLDGSATTFKVVVTRTAWFDPDSVARVFVRHDALGRTLGVLSPRDTIRARIAGAAISIGYSRPAARGRVIFGDVVPYDQVWRTGANAATELEIDRAITINRLVIPSGRYTLWTVPGRESWILIVNRQTGQWGTSYDPAQDVARIEIPAQSLAVPVERFTIDLVPTGDGGEIQLTWARTRAVARFTIQR